MYFTTIKKNNISELLKFLFTIITDIPKGRGKQVDHNFLQDVPGSGSGPGLTDQPTEL